jgi:glycosyltransferase involved in cell wall biosynthesis
VKDSRGDIKKKIILVANSSWFLVNFELPFIKELQTNNFEVVVIAPNDNVSSLFKEMGVRHYSVRMDRKGINPFSDIRLMIHLYKIYRKEAPDVVFHNTIKPVIYGSIAARWSGVTCILNMISGLGHVFVGDETTHRLLRAVVKKMYKFALKFSNKIFFQNPDDEAYFLQCKLAKRRQTEITYGLGVDLEKFYLVEPQIQNGKCTFILIARMLWDKGIGEFVEAAKEVKQLFPFVNFMLLGKIDKGNPSGIDEETIRGWTDAGIVHYLGEVADIRDILGKADVVVLPSYYREGVPNSLMEAMAMGKPIITTNTPGCRETVINDVNGILIPPRDVHALVEAMKFMIKKPTSRSEMGKAGRKLAEERFDVRRVNAQLLKTLNIS